MPWMLNWLWQGCSVAAATLLVLRLSGRASAATRYRLAWTGLLGVLLLPVVPALTSVISRWLAPGSAARTAVDTHASAAPLMVVPELSSRFGFALLVVWAVVSAVLLLRVARATRHLVHVKRTSVPFPRDREARLSFWSRLRGQGRRVRLALSAQLTTPGAFGFRRGAIVIPAGLAARLSEADLDSIVVHEYAHLQRRDDLACLVQGLVRAVAWWHPAVWWLDRTLTLEREAACDDWVVRLAGDPKRYASCLVDLAAMTLPHDAALVPGALTRRPQLTVRVERLLDRARARTPHASPMRVLASVAPVVAATVLLGQLGPAVLGHATLVAALLAGRGHGVWTSLAPTLSSPVGDVLVDTRRTDRRPGSTRASRPATALTTAVARSSGAAPAATSGPDPLVVPIHDRFVFPTQGRADVAPLGSTPMVAHARIPTLTPSTSSTAPVSTWSTLASAGTTIGQGSRRAATATAGVFTRAGKSLAAAF